MKRIYLSLLKMPQKSKLVRRTWQELSYPETQIAFAAGWGGNSTNKTQF